MGPGFLSNSARDANAITYFEIRCVTTATRSELTTDLMPRPDESNLVFRGAKEEASSVLLKGTLVLCLSEPLRIQGLRLRLTGEKRLGYDMAMRVS